MDTKPMTIRLSIEQADELEALARIEGIPVSRAIREAIREHIEARRKDPDFVKRAKEIIERDRDILKRLAR